VSRGAEDISRRPEMSWRIVRRRLSTNAVAIFVKNTRLDSKNSRERKDSCRATLVISVQVEKMAGRRERGVVPRPERARSVTATRGLCSLIFPSPANTETCSDRRV